MPDLTGPAISALFGLLGGLLAEPLKKLITITQEGVLARRTALRDVYALLGELCGTALLIRETWPRIPESTKPATREDMANLARAYTGEVDLLVASISFKLYDEHYKDTKVFEKLPAPRTYQRIVSAVRPIIESWKSPEINLDHDDALQAWGAAIDNLVNVILDALREPLRVRELEERRLLKAKAAWLRTFGGLNQNRLEASVEEVQASLRGASEGLAQLRQANAEAARVLREVLRRTSLAAPEHPEQTTKIDGLRELRDVARPPNL